MYLTFGSVPTGAAKIKYTPSALSGDNPLQDTTGNKAAPFTHDLGS